MTGPEEHADERGEPPVEPDSPAKGDAPEHAGADGEPSGANPPRRDSRRRSKRPVLKFVVGLGILVGGFNVVFITWFSKGDAFASYMDLNTEVSAAIVRILGDEATTSGPQILGERYTINLKRGCDALQAAAFFVFAVLTSPVGLSMRSRILPIVVGTLLLLIINLVRIVSLYYTGVFFPSAFDAMHIEVWQAVFIFLPILFWLIWLARAMRRAAAIHHAS